MKVIEQLIKDVAYNQKELFDDHWKEVYGRSGADIDLDFFCKMEEAGACFGLWAYYEEVIVGYSINFIAPNLHQRGRITCSNDALYVDPLFRDTPLGMRLIRETERKAKEKGADLMTWYAPVNTNLGKILPRLKYECLETVNVKEI